MKNRTSKMISDIGSLDARVFLWKVARYLFVFVFIFSIIAGLLVYFVVSFAMGFSPFSSWGEMNNFHIQFAVSLALGMVLFSVLLTLMLIEIYQKVIYYPIRELLNEFNIFSHKNRIISRNKKDVSTHELGIFKVFTPQDNWTEAVRNAVNHVSEDLYTDELTQCMNRKYLSDIVPELLRTYILCSVSDQNMPKTNASACCGIYLIDIDFFKSINDEFGHLCGDEVLKEVGATLMKCVSDRGFVIRNGGEEFLVFISQSYPMDYAAHAETLRKTFAESVRVPADANHPERNVTCSIGFTPYPLFDGPNRDLSLQEHVDIADQAMYIAKGGGRNTWRGIEPIRMPGDAKDLEMALSSLEYGISRGYYKIVKPEEKQLFKELHRPGNYFIRGNG